MAERPDLDAVEMTARGETGPFWDAVRATCAYARELEEENKRLRQVAHDIHQFCPQDPEIDKLIEGVPQP